LQSANYEFGIIAGSGNLPKEIISQCRNNNINLFVIAIRGISDEECIFNANGEIALGEIGKCIKLFKNNGVKKIAFAGYVKRPDFANLGFDTHGMMLLPKLLAAAKSGDDAIMRVILDDFEKNGLDIIGPEMLLQNLLAPFGTLTTNEPNETAWEDIKKAAKIINKTSEFDIGQAVVVAEGIVLALEAQEGTDAMINRINQLPIHLRGDKNCRKGILLKATKAIQDKRIDLPVIGLTTLENANKANLCGIAVEASGALISHKKDLIERANQYGMFIIGFSRELIDE
jgi:UDP-2,3-diacylglucosamine hydrolase